MDRRSKFAVSLALLCGAIGLYHALPIREAMARQLWGLSQIRYQEYAAKLGARVNPRLDRRFAPASPHDLPPVPEASPAGGLHPSPVSVTLALAGKGREAAPDIHYTLDGSVPTRRDPVYRAPIALSKTTVLRFRCLPPSGMPGETRTRSYFIGDTGRLPVLALATDPVNLWNRYSGIYENATERGRSWERETDLEYFPGPGAAPVRLNGELRIHGGYSRLVAMKSFRYRYALPGDVPLDSGHILRRNALGGKGAIIIRAGGSAHGSRLRDNLSALAYARAGGLSSAFEPVRLHLNGEFWGVYDLRERIDSAYLISRLGPGDYELLAFDSKNRHDWATPVAGKADAWQKTLAFFRAGEVSDAERIRTAAELLDLENITDYWIHNIYAANVDWPYNNINVFRRTDGGDTRWKWIAWDADGAFDHQGKGLRHNTLAWSLRDRVRNDLKWNYKPGVLEDIDEFLVSTLFLRRLLGDPGFRLRFQQRACDRLNTVYRAEPMTALFDSLVGLYAADRARDFARWGWKDSAYHADLDRVKAFIRLRPAITREHLAAYFGLGDAVEVRLEATGPGLVKLNTLDFRDTVWAGDYPKGLAVDLAAVADSGAQFLGWRGLPAGTPAPEEGLGGMRLRLSGPLRVTAAFGPAPRTGMNSAQ